MIYWVVCELNGEPVRQESLLTIVFDVCLICVCNLFEEMAAWKQVLNFEMIFGGFAILVLVSLQMLGFWKLSLFEWVLKKWDIPIWRRFNFELSFKLCIWKFLDDHKVGLDTLLWVQSRGAKIHKSFYWVLKVWDSQSRHES